MVGDGGGSVVGPFQAGDRCQWWVCLVSCRGLIDSPFCESLIEFEIWVWVCLTIVDEYKEDKEIIDLSCR